MSSGKRIVIAVGGNALVQRHHPLDAAPQQVNVALAAAAIAGLAKCNDLIVTHGNGPQVGMLAIETAADTTLGAAYPLDALVAETQGLIGYWLAQALHNELGPETPIVALVTRALVSLDDAAFASPAKFIGATYTKAAALEAEPTLGWQVRQDGDAWRRVVPSPEPIAILETAVIRQLVEARTIVICGGGGGVPVIMDEQGRLHGVEAVVDKDVTSALLAEAIGADMLLLLTDADAVLLDFGTTDEQPILRATPEELRRREFPAGSMGPKVDAACRFVERTGRVAAIGALTQAERIMAGDAGTIITATGQYP